MTINLLELLYCILAIVFGGAVSLVTFALLDIAKALKHISSCVLPVEEVQKRTEAIQAASYSQDKFLKDMEEVNNRLRKDAGLM